MEIIDATHANLHPCTGCTHCGYESPCIQKDDMERLRQQILHADMLVFVTPLYYYGMSAQLKILVDRFCAINSSINRKHMKSALFTAAWNADSWTFDLDTLESHYQTLVRYLRRSGHGAGLWVRYALHDAEHLVSRGGLSTWAQFEAGLKTTPWPNEPVCAI